MRVDPKDITVSVATRDDHRALLAFLMEQYPQLGWSEPSMEWQYYLNPVGTAKSWVAKHQGKVVANYTAIPHTLRVEGALRPSWRVQDVITHPEYRGAGLYGRLSDEANRFLQNSAFDLNFTFPNENSHGGFIKRNWVASQRIPLWIDSALHKPSVSSLNAEPIEEFGEEDAAIWRDYAESIRYGVERSAAYLNWRYFQKPLGTYSAFRFSSKGSRAVGIFKIFDKGKGEKYAHLCDLFWEPGFKELGEGVKFFRAFAQEHGATQSSLWSPPESPLATQLAELGFTLNTHLTRWLVLNTNSTTLDSASVSRFSHWHLTMGDSDVY